MRKRVGKKEKRNKLTEQLFVVFGCMDEIGGLPKTEATLLTFSWRKVMSAAFVYSSERPSSLFPQMSSISI